VKRAILSSLLFVVLFAAADARADTLGDAFLRANQAFLARDDLAAIAGYRWLIDSGVDDAEVYYNLATAYARTGKLGRAIQFYERVLRLRPGDDDARQALAAVRQELAREVVARHPEARVKERPPLFAALTDDVTSNGAAALFLVTWLLAFGLLLSRRFVEREVPRLVVGVALVAAALASAVTGGLLVSKGWSDHGAHEAIVVAEEIHALSGPGHDFEEAWTAVEGTRVRVLAREGRWVLVRGPSEHEGWVPRGHVGVI
jgi:tetratricopeptide (TPR) repeat protein